MGTLFSTSVNPLFHSLKDIIPELSIQLTNFHSDVNGHQNTSMDFLCSNFLQINDNVVTVKMMFLVLHLSVICKKFSSIDQGFKYVLIHLNHYNTRALIPVTRWSMQINPKHQSWTTRPMKFLHKIVTTKIKTKNMKMSVLYNSN